MSGHFAPSTVVIHITPVNSSRSLTMESFIDPLSRLSGPGLPSRSATLYNRVIDPSDPGGRPRRAGCRAGAWPEGPLGRCAMSIIHESDSGPSWRSSALSACAPPPARRAGSLRRAPVLRRCAFVQRGTVAGSRVPGLAAPAAYGRGVGLVPVIGNHGGLICDGPRLLRRRNHRADLILDRPGHQRGHAHVASASSSCSASIGAARATNSLAGGHRTVFFRACT